MPAPDAPATPARITIEEATSIFIANRESAQIAPATLRKYRTFTKRGEPQAATVRTSPLRDQLTLIS